MLKLIGFILLAGGIAFGLLRACGVSAGRSAAFAGGAALLATVALIVGLILNGDR